MELVISAVMAPEPSNLVALAATTQGRRKSLVEHNADPAAKQQRAEESKRGTSLTEPTALMRTAADR